jgi:hypothetical protein
MQLWPANTELKYRENEKGGNRHFANAAFEFLQGQK